MTTCQLCGKDLSEDGGAELCENCQGLQESISQEQRAKTVPTKRKLWQRLLPIIIPLLVALIVNYIPRIGTADAKEAAVRTVQELVLSETGVFPYTEAHFAQKSPVSVVFSVNYSPTREDMKQGKYSQRLVGVSLSGNKVDFISDPFSSDKSEMS